MPDVTHLRHAVTVINKDFLRPFNYFVKVFRKKSSREYGDQGVKGPSYELPAFWVERSEESNVHL